MAVSRPSNNSDWMMHPSFVFKTFEESLIKSPFPYSNTPHVVPEKILESFVDQNGIRFYRVKWVDNWLTEQHVSANFPHLMTEYWINKPINDNVDYQAYPNQARTTLSSLPLTMPASLSITKTARTETKAQTSSATLHHITPQPSTSVMSIPQLFSNDNNKQQSTGANLLSAKANAETDFIVGESLKLPEKLNIKSDLTALKGKKSEMEEKNLHLPKTTDNSIILFLDKTNLYEVQSPSKKKDTSVFASKPQVGPALTPSFDNPLHQFVNQAAMQLPQMDHLNSQRHQATLSQMLAESGVEERRTSMPKKVITKQQPQQQQQQQQATPKDKQPVTCDICGKSISSRKNLRVHKTVKHFKNGNFACNVCGRKFALNRDLKRHMPLHTNERKYVCPYCGLQCKQPGHLTKHIRTHTEVMNWRCDCCFKNFKVQADLKEHCFTEHANIKDRNLTCSVCKEKLKLPNSVYLHSLRHSGVREFECHICKATFKLKQHMQVHLKTHEKPKEAEKISCEICEKQFRFRHMYERHLAKHVEKTAEEYQENKRLKEEEKRSKLEKKRIADMGKRRRGSKSGDDDSDSDVERVGRNLSKRKRRKPSRVLYNEELKTKLLVRQKALLKKESVCPHCNELFKSKALLNSHVKLHKQDVPAEDGPKVVQQNPNVGTKNSEENGSDDEFIIEPVDSEAAVLKSTSVHSGSGTRTNDVSDVSTNESKCALMDPCNEIETNNTAGTKPNEILSNPSVTTNADNTTQQITQAVKVVSRRSLSSNNDSQPSISNTNDSQLPLSSNNDLLTMAANNVIAEILIAAHHANARASVADFAPSASIRNATPTLPTVLPPIELTIPGHGMDDRLPVPNEFTNVVPPSPSGSTQIAASNDKS